ncbi:hypothetical protein COM86_26710 [Priestia megaterium]|jgi:hypothetical protein|uniref:hypothetical protein n=1 Tax=Priestia TaxID=2800373 RepID=UPI000BEE5CDD|nr:hypothetical protein [Priestia megaterium]PEB61017.1 hypothetical protein COM86_26710 [Priestia megaterium]PEE77300.1 hypothetical protein COM81_08445 [Priestia megaterium]PFI85961.1 hypothetical protein COI84_28350 [Priestia megaterium]PGR06423.1 hypothetical protein COC62_27250 [Priestia megaterium]
MNEKQDTINAEEMAKRLNTTSSNIRKWCIELEKHGYEFVKDNRKKRYYSVTDQSLLSNLKYAIQEKKLSLEIAAMTVIKGFDRKRSSSGTQEEHLKKEENNRELSVTKEHNNHTTDAVLNTMKNQFEQQQSINNKLLEMLDSYKGALEESENRRRSEQEHMNKQLKELEERLAVRISEQISNRDKEMMEYIRSSQKQQQEQYLEIAATQQNEEEQKKGFFARLLGK